MKITLFLCLSVFIECQVIDVFFSIKICNYLNEAIYSFLGVSSVTF